MANTDHRIKSWAFRSFSADKKDGTFHGGRAFTALNALMVANQWSWEETYRSLLDQAHSLSLMPDDPKCIKAMLRTQGFVQQPGVKGEVTIEDVCRGMNERCHDGQIAIIETDKGWFSGGMYAVVPESHGAFIGGACRVSRYQCVGENYPEQNRVREVWVRWADREDHSPVRRRTGHGRTGRSRQAPESHAAFHHYQANPAGNSIGDCSVRAVASAFGITWDEAMERLAGSAGHTATAINTSANINKTLEKEGFLPCPAVKVNGKQLTGKEFCREMAARYHNGEKILAYVGKSHVAAVLPFEEDGAAVYKIVDSWDSTDRKIGVYYVKPVPQPPAPAREKGASLEKLAVGTRLIHPVFGEGTVDEDSGTGWVDIVFARGGRRKLDAKWVLRNCTRCA